MFFSYLCGWKNYMIYKKSCAKEGKSIKQDTKDYSDAEVVMHLCIILLRLYGLQNFWVGNMPLLWNLCKKY